MVFKAGDPPPSYACDAQSNENTSKRSRGKVVLVHEAYAGNPKGMRQVLWERGLYAEGMSASADAPAEKMMDDIISNLPDFKNCLLYTSPSPRDQRGSRMPSSA